MKKYHVISLLALLFVAGTLLRLYQLDNRSLWFDESFSWALSQFSLHELIDRTGQDVHPPFYYLSLKAWTLLFGTSVFAMRMLSVAFASLTLVGVYLFSRDAFSYPDRIAPQRKEIGLVAVALVAFSSVQIRWAQEVRMYTLGTALAIFSSWMLLGALKAKKNDSRWWFTGYSITAAAFLYTHNYALFSVFAQGLFFCGVYFYRLIVKHRRVWESHKFWQGLVALGMTLWLYSPWIPILLQQKRRVQDNYWIKEINPWSVPDAFQSLFFPRNHYAIDSHFWSVVIFCLIGLSLVLFLRKRRSLSHWLAVSMVIVPVSCAIMISLVSVSIIVNRHFIFTQLFLFVILAYLFAVYLNRRLERYALVGLLLFNLGVVHISYLRDVEIPQAPGVKGAVQYILAERRPDEPVVCLHPCIYHSVKFYSQGEVDPKLLLVGKKTNHSENIMHYTGGPILTRDDLMAISELEQVDSKIWVVDSSGYTVGIKKTHPPFTWAPAMGFSRNFQGNYFFDGVTTATLFQKQLNN